MRFRSRGRKRRTTGRRRGRVTSRRRRRGSKMKVKSPYAKRVGIRY